MKKRTLTLIVLLIILVALIACKSIFENGICSFYNICEWITYLFIVPIVYVIASLFIKIKKPFIPICASTIGILIPILLNRDWATGFILQKMVVTLLGSIATYLVVRKCENSEITNLK